LIANGYIDSDGKLETEDDPESEIESGEDEVDKNLAGFVTMSLNDADATDADGWEDIDENANDYSDSDSVESIPEEEEPEGFEGDILEEVDDMLSGESDSDEEKKN
jgi:hypothetical protein